MSAFRAMLYEVSPTDPITLVVVSYQKARSSPSEVLLNS